MLGARYPSKSWKHSEMVSKKTKSKKATPKQVAAPDPTSLLVAAKAAKKKKAPGGGAKAPLSDAGMMYLRCLLDPFSEPPCHMPDLYGGLSVAFKLVNEYTVTSDGAGYAVFAAHPALAAGDLAWTVTAGAAAASSTSTPHPDYTSVNAAYLWSRLVCFGVEVTYLGAPSTASGGLTCIQTPLTTDINSAVLANIYDDGEFGRADKGRVVVARPVQEPRFESTSLTSTNTPAFPTIVFIGAGLVTGVACFRVRVTRHMEGLPQRNNLLRAMATDSPVDMRAMEVASAVAGKSNTSTNEPAARIEAKKAAAQVASTAISTAAPYAAAGAGQLVKWAGEAALSWML